MAGFMTAVVSASASTADPPQQTISLPTGFGVPTGVIITACLATADATAVDDAVLCTGGSDGTNQWVYGVAAEHGVGTTNTIAYGNSGYVIMTVDAGTQAIDGYAALGGFETDKVKIVWNSYPATAIKLVVWACTGTTKVIAGTDTNTQISGNTQATTLTGMGTATAIVMASAIQAGLSGSPSGGNPAQHSVGFVAYDGSTITQVGLGLYMEDGNASGKNTQHLSTTKVMEPPDDGTAGGAAGLKVTAIGSASFTTEKLNNNENLVFGYLALETTGEAYADTWDVATGTPTYTDEYSLPSGPDDFQPHSGLLLLTGLNTTEVDADQTGVRAGTFGLAFFDADASSGQMVSIQNQRNAATTNTQSYYSSKILDIQNHTGASTLIEGDLSSVNDDGFVGSITDSPANAKSYPVLLFGNLTLGPTDLDGADVIPSPTVNAVIAPDDLDGADKVPRPTLDVNITVSPTDLDGGVGLPGPTVSLNVRQPGFSPASEVSAGKSEAAGIAGGRVKKAEVAQGRSDSSMAGSTRIAKTQVSSGHSAASH